MKENKENIEITNNEGAEKPSPNRKRKVMDFVAKVLCLVIAFFIWFYAMSADVITLERDFTVPVQFENETDLYEKTGWSVLSGRDSRIVVTLKGKRDIINQITESDIQASVDLSQVEDAGRQTLDIKVSAPTECEIINTSVSSLSPIIDKRVTKNVPIKVEYIDYVVNSEYQLDEPILNIEEITLTGPEEELRRVTAAQAELPLGNITQTISSSNTLSLVDDKGNKIESIYITMSAKSVNVTVRLYTEKEIPLKTDYKYGYFNDKNVKVSISPAYVTLRGEPSVLENIDSLTLATLDEKKYVSNTTQTVSISVPDGATLVTAEKSAVISIEHIGTGTKQITVNNIVLANAGGLECELQTESLNITLRGPYNLLSKITEENITVTADMKNYTSGSGSTVVPVTLEFSQDFENSVYELDSYSVTMNIK